MVHPTDKGHVMNFCPSDILDELDILDIPELDVVPDADDDTDEDES